LLVSCLWKFPGLCQRLKDVRLGSRSQHAITFRSKAFKYPYYLLGRFARTVDNFWKAPADLAMVVDTRKTQVFKRQVAQVFNRILDTDFAGFYLLQ
jgi:hypothetical protein